MSTTYQIHYSTELMQNYLQASVMAPERQFQAVQDADGRALLFSIGSKDAGSPFNVTVEVPGARHGWKTVNLSSGYPGQTCQHFAAAQRADGSVHLAMILREATGTAFNDTLYLAEFAVTAAAGMTVPSWTAMPYDNSNTPRPRLEIAGVFLSEVAEGAYVIADVVRDPGSQTKAIARYFLDPAKHGGSVWQVHDVPVDIESENYDSVVGRKADAGVDGVYVSGQIDGSPQIIYTPLYNELQRSRHPLSAYLKLTSTGGMVADAIAACRLADGTSDLYATAGGLLYRFASTNQGNNATAVVAARSALFQGVKDLFAYADADTVVVWGRNRDNAIFYTSCPLARIEAVESWSYPVPLLLGVEQVSPFLNRTNSANTIFAHTGENDLRVGVKSPDTGSWSWRQVTLPPADAKTPARQFSSYTTRVDVRDAQNRPACGIALAVSATNLTSVYINHLYYIVGPTPIHVATDATGALTIIEAVPRLTGTQLRITVAGDAPEPTSINPMDKAFKRATDLQSVQALRDATITTYVNGKPSTPRKLIRSGVDDQTLKQVATLNKQCAAVYADPTKAPPAALMAAAQGPDVAKFVVPADAPVVDAGDLFQFLETEATARKLRAADAAAGGMLAAQESFWDMLVRWFEDAWEFVVKIGEAIYRCVLEIIEDVVAAVRWVFDKIVAAIDDLIEFLQYLFAWDDFQRAKDVIKNVTLSFLEHQTGQLASFRTTFDKGVDDIIAAINNWAGIKDFPGLGQDGAAPSATRRQPTHRMRLRA